MKVYIVTSGQYSDIVIRAVYSTREAAEEHIQTVNRLKCSDNEEIEEWELDTLPLPVWTIVCIRKDGGVDRVEYEVASREAEYNISFGEYRGVGPVVQFCVQTDDKERAIKIANERRTAILMANVWGDDELARQVLFGL